jgi:FkbM family methyltransferase
MLPFISNLSFIFRHPLNRNNRLRALRRLVAWHIGSRLFQGAVAVPFVDATRLLVSPGMTGATGNIFCGLHDFEEMAFLLHALRPGDLFVDIGANVGSYTILASGAAGAHCLSFEPVPSTFAHLVDNLRLNDLYSLVAAKNIGIGAAPGVLTFTTGLDTVNHVLAANETAEATIEVRTEPLDAMVANSPVTVMKIDVEGFETEVLNGASNTMQSPSLLAVIIELNGSGLRYGQDDSLLNDRMMSWGFRPASYDPFQRSLTVLDGPYPANDNVLYVRDVKCLRERVQAAPRHTVLGTTL